MLRLARKVNVVVDEENKRECVVKAVAVSCEGDVAVVGGNKAVYWFGLGSSAESKRVANLDGLRDLAWAGQGKSKCIVAGYANGLVRIIGALGSRSTVQNKEFVFHGGKVQAIKIVKARKHEQVWILYEDRVFVSVQLQHLMESPSWTDIQQLQTWKIKHQEQIKGFAPFFLSNKYHSPENMFNAESTSTDLACGFVMVGVKPSWAIYVIEKSAMEKPKQVGLGSIATSVATSWGNSVVSLAKSWMFSKSEITSPLSPGEEEAESSGDQEPSQNSASTGSNSNKELPLSARHCIYDSASRVFNGNLNSSDPSGRYCVSVDQLGRVALIDTHGLRMIKIWKGYRDAQTGWLSCPEKWSGQWEGRERSNTTSALEKRPAISVIESIGRRKVHRWGQFLVLLAPWRQTIQIWRVPGCVLLSSIRLPSICSPESVFLSTIIDPRTRLARCLLAQQGEAAENEWNFYNVEVDMDGLERLHVHLSRGKNQKESFTVHQLRRNLFQNNCLSVPSLFAQCSSISTLWKLLHVLDSHFPVPTSFTHEVQLELTDVATRVISSQRSSLLQESGLENESDEHPPSAKILRVKKMIEETDALLHFFKLRRQAIQLHKSLQISAESWGNLEDLFEAADAKVVGGAGLKLSQFSHVSAPLLSAGFQDALSLRDLLTMLGVSASKESIPSSKWPAAALHLDVNGLSAQRRSELGMFLFLPLIADVFLLPRIESALTALQMSKTCQEDLLLDWWYSIDPKLLNTVLSSGPRNGLSRFLERFRDVQFEDVSVKERNIDNEEDQLDDTDDEDEVHANREEESDEERAKGDVVKSSRSSICKQVLLRVYSSTYIANSLCLLSAAQQAKSFLPDDPEVKSSEQQLIKAGNLVVRLGEAGIGVTPETLASQNHALSFTQVVGVALARRRIREDDQAKVVATFPEHFEICRDEITCIKVIELIKSTAPGESENERILLECIHEISNLKETNLRAALAFRIWNSKASHLLGSLLETEVEIPDHSVCLIDFAKSLILMMEIGHTAPPVKKKQVQTWPPIENALSICLWEEFQVCKDMIPHRFFVDQIALASLQAISIIDKSRKSREGPTKEDERRKRKLASTLQHLFPSGETILGPIEGCASLNGGSNLSEDDDLIEGRRLQLVQRYLRSFSLPNDEMVEECFEVAATLRVPLDKVRQEYAQILYARGLDSKGEKVLDQVDDKETIAMMLLAVARTRMCGILASMQGNPKYRHLIAVISADTTRWIMAVGLNENGLVKLSLDGTGSTSSLSSTLILLRQIQGWLPAGNPAQQRAIQMTRAADALWRRIEDMRL